MTARCVRCGESYERRTSNQKYCPACRQPAQREAATLRTRRRREAEKARRVRVPKPTACKGCVYAVYVCNWWACDYLGITGHRRPCPSMYAAGRCEARRKRGAK